jgi:hypothetical protein
MVQRVYEAAGRDHSGTDASNPITRAALESLLAEYVKPFELSREESLAYNGREPYGPSMRRIQALKGALDRACGTLAPTAGGEWTLSDGEKLWERFDSAWTHCGPERDISADEAMTQALNECFPHAKPGSHQLTGWERRQIEAFRGSVKDPASTKGEMLLLLDRAYPKSAPVVASVEELMHIPVRLRRDDWHAQLEAALAAQKAKP